MKPISYFFRMIKSKPAGVLEYITNVAIKGNIARFSQSPLFGQMLNIFYAEKDVAAKWQAARIWSSKTNERITRMLEERPMVSMGIGLTATAAAIGIPRSLHMRYQMSKIEEEDKRWMVQQEWEGNPAFQMWNNRTNHALMR